MYDEILIEKIVALIKETAEAHHQAYIATDGAHPDWPMWYAEHMHKELGALLNASFTQSELVYLLVLLSNEQPLRAPGADWARYYAKRLLELYA